MNLPKSNCLGSLSINLINTNIAYKLFFDVVVVVIVGGLFLVAIMIMRMFFMMLSLKMKIILQLKQQN